MYAQLYKDVDVNICMMGVGQGFIYVSVHMYLLKYIYKDVGIYKGFKAIFFVVCSGTCI